MNKLPLLCFCMIITTFISAQQQYTIKGYITEQETGEALISSNIFDVTSALGTVTNNFGFYSLTLPASEVALLYTYIGFATQSKKFILNKDTTINLELSNSLDLEEIEVVADKVVAKSRETQMSTISLGAKEIKAIPALLGEVDVLKSLQLLPGVQSGGEGQSGLYVRGGSPDQNLLLLDGVPVYNASHLFGFFSVFNADAIKDVKLIKGGFPARYGGRLSSVIEVNMKEGNKKEFKGAGSIGLISSKLTLEGPIGDKTSFMLSGRRTYIDLLARPLIKSSLKQDGIDGVLGYYFYDFNGKINHTFSDKNRLYLSFYSGRDAFYYNATEDTDDRKETNNTNLGWGNYTSVLRWNHLFQDNLFANLALSYSRYNINTGVSFSDLDKSNNQSNEFSFNYSSGIEDIALNYTFDYLPNPDHYIKYGVSAIHHRFNPGQFKLFSKENQTIGLDTVIGQKIVPTLEYAAFVEDEVKINKKLSLNAGLHFSAFSVQKKNYFSIQPRLSSRYMLQDDLSLKASFSTMRQYTQLLAFEGLGLPTDLWVPSTKRIKPQDAWQVSLGLAKDLGNDYEFSAETYYKGMSNLIAFKDGNGIFQIDDWQDRVTQGKGRSFGFELYAKKKTGKLTGWIGYTWSKTDRKFDDVNFDTWFPFKYDRRHDISVVGQYEISKKWSFSGSWVYGTGNTATITYQKVPQQPWDYIKNDLSSIDLGTFAYGGYSIVENRNNYRLRPFHRLDLGFARKVSRKTWDYTVSFGAYNAYNRKNPFFVDYDTVYADGGGDGKIVLKEYSLFPVIPYINFGFEF